MGTVVPDAATTIVVRSVQNQLSLVWLEQRYQFISLEGTQVIRRGLPGITQTVISEQAIIAANIILLFIA
jgi:hypothetical protein